MRAPSHCLALAVTVFVHLLEKNAYLVSAWSEGQHQNNSYEIRRRVKRDDSSTLNGERSAESDGLYGDNTSSRMLHCCSRVARWSRLLRTLTIQKNARCLEFSQVALLEIQPLLWRFS